MKPVTLIYCVKDDAVLLGYKKRGFGADKLNGYGGKANPGESLEEAAVRELKEEVNIDAKISDLEKVAVIDFYFKDVPKEKCWDQTVHVYILRNWSGNPQETEEMRPEWHTKKALPVDKMWIDDAYWLPSILDGKKVRGLFEFIEEGKKISGYAIKYLDEL